MKDKDIGALWIKKGAKGEYMTGTVDHNGQVLSIVCFLNSYKKQEKHPTWKIYRAKEQPVYNQVEKNQTELNNLKSEISAENGDTEIDINQIPF